MPRLPSAASAGTITRHPRTDGGSSPRIVIAESSASTHFFHQFTTYASMPEKTNVRCESGA
jgi:hypothetical protein